MSIENHPNFHAVKFATDLVHTIYQQYDNPPKAKAFLKESYYNCLRGKANPTNAPDVTVQIDGFLYAGRSQPGRHDIVNFVGHIENLVDTAVSCVPQV